MRGVWCECTVWCNHCWFGAVAWPWKANDDELYLFGYGSSLFCDDDAHLVKYLLVCWLCKYCEHVVIYMLLFFIFFPPVDSLCVNLSILSYLLEALIVFSHDAILILNSTVMSAGI